MKRTYLYSMLALVACSLLASCGRRPLEDMSEDNTLILIGTVWTLVDMIVENGSDLDWIIEIDGLGFLICDNLPDMLSWASDATPSANVLNLDGFAPSTQYTGTGTTTLYVCKPTANANTSAEVSGTIVNAVDPTRVSIEVIQLPNYDMTTVRDNYMKGEYVGAFWKANQKGERIIRIPVNAAARAGEWDVSVIGWEPVGKWAISYSVTTDRTIQGLLSTPRTRIRRICLPPTPHIPFRVMCHRLRGTRSPASATT